LALLLLYKGSASFSEASSGCMMDGFIVTLNG
jgi:hypothetical protein